jgi:hypothetical protein
MGKNDEGLTQYQLFNWDRPYEVRDGEEAPILTGYEACENYAIGLGISKDRITPFPKIKEFEIGAKTVAVGTVEEIGDEALPF